MPQYHAHRQADGRLGRLRRVRSGPDRGGPPGAVACLVTGWRGGRQPGTEGDRRPRQATRPGARRGRRVGPQATHEGPLGALRAAYEEPTLTFAGPTDRASYEARLKEPGPGRQSHARRLLSLLDAGNTDREPAQVSSSGVRPWRRPDDADPRGRGRRRLRHPVSERLGGEGSKPWVAAYANDVFGYVPSVRVLKEGGYEGLEASIIRRSPRRSPSPSRKRSTGRPAAWWTRSGACTHDRPVRGPR